MSLGGGGGGQLQQVAEEIEELEQHKEAIREEIEGLQAEKREIDEAVEAVEEIESGATVQVPLGGGAYVRAEVADIDEIIVELGADYAAEREQEGAISSLKAKKETLDSRIEDLRSDIAEIETETEKLEEQAEQMQAQQMQQMQQMQQQQDE
ncbi:MAG: prefoldin subunit alpha [Halovenus sp.]